MFRNTANISAQDESFAPIIVQRLLPTLKVCVFKDTKKMLENVNEHKLCLSPHNPSGLSQESH